MRRWLILLILLGLSAHQISAANSIDSKLSPSLRLLRSAHQNADIKIPETIRSVSAAPELKVSIRFAPPADPALWESRGLRLRRIEGKYAGSGTVYGAIMTWEEIEKWIQDPGILTIASDWHPGIIPCLNVSAPEVGATEVWQMTSPAGLPITGTGQLVADFDTGVDIFHPALFRPSEYAYEWLDVDSNGVMTPGVDVVDLNGNGIGEREEITRFFDGQIYDPAMTFQGNGISNADGFYQADWDWIYNDFDDNGQRDYGPGAYTESDPGYGEMVFYCDDANGNNDLDVGEQLILLAESKVLAVMEPDTVRRRGIDLIQTTPDFNGHGTAVSGVLVGGEPDRSRFCSLAPGADLLMGYYFNGVSFEDYLPWVRDEGCKVQLYEFGGFVFNPLDGSTNEEILLDTLAGQGVMQVTPSGNLNRGFKHCQLQIVSGEDVPVQIGVEEWQGEPPTAVLSTYLWREPAVELTFSIEDPWGYTVDLEGAGNYQYFGSWIVWSGFWVSPRGTAEYDFFLWGTSGEPTVGTWILTIHHPGGAAFEVNGYVTDDVTAWEGGAEFIDYQSNDKTVTWPATADSAFVLGSYSTRGYEQYIGVGSGSIQPGEISLFSGRGTRIDGVHILSLAAPGNYDIYTIRSVYGDPYTHGGYRQFSGTSAAGPHVAASAVLALQADTTLSRSEVENLLETYALEDEFTGPTYNDTWGYGKLRIDDLVTYLDVPPGSNQPSLPETMAISAYPNPFNATVSIRIDLPARQKVNLSVYNLVGRKVGTIYSGPLEAGYTQMTWDAEEVSSGIYWFRLKGETAQKVSKVVILK